MRKSIFIRHIKPSLSSSGKKRSGFYKLGWYDSSGKERSSSHQTKKEAQAAKTAKARELHESGAYGVSYNKLSDEDKRSLYDLKTYADERGIDLWAAVRRYEKLLKDSSATPITVKEAVELCLADKEKEGVDARSVSTMRSPCRRFGVRYPRRQLSDIQHSDVTEWIDSLGVRPRTRLGYLTELRTLFSWATQKGYADFNPVVAAMPTKKTRKKIMDTKREVRKSQVLTPEECRIIMDYCENHYPDLTGYAALALFAGLRPEKEATLIDWDQVTEAHITVDWRIAKDRETRIIEPLTPNLVEWIKLVKSRGVEPYVNHKRKWDNVKKQIVRPWPHDACRHTYASYHFAMFKDAGLTAKNLGHPNADLLRKDYNSAVTEAAARQFWLIGRAKRGAGLE